MFEGRDLSEMSGYQLEDTLAEYARRDAEMEAPFSGPLGNTDDTKRGRGTTDEFDRGRSENRLEGKL